MQSIGREFEYMMYCLARCEIQPFEELELDGVTYTALPVTHAQGTYGYLIETEQTRMFYACDTGKLPPETAERVRGVDILAMDATYWKENGYPQSHHSVQETIEEGFELDAKKIYLTHLCMHYVEPITLAQLEDYLKQYDGRVEPAADGLSFEV
jgi:phosphoribosyl 1,2-cyclic phosphate phosphodiesterase